MMRYCVYGKNNQSIKLDPRTKLLLCLCISVTLIAGSSAGVLRYLNYIPALVPFLFMISLKKYKNALIYLAVYVVCEIGTSALVPYLPDAVNILFTGVIAFSTRLIPGAMMGWFLFSTTTVSEFVAAMDRMHVTKKITVPISVMFRFLPTIREEYTAVKKAMRLREAGSFRNPVKMLEYRMVPFLMSVVSIGNDLAASALTRGLDSPCKRTNMCRIAFTWRDVAVVALLIIFYSCYIPIAVFRR